MKNGAKREIEDNIIKNIPNEKEMMKNIRQKGVTILKNSIIIRKLKILI